MKLNVQDRLILLSVLPSEGDLVTLRVVRDLRGELGFSEEEIAQIGLKAEDGGYAWRSEANTYEKDVPIGPKACEVVVRAFEVLDKAQKLTLQHLATYEKFLTP